MSSYFRILILLAVLPGIAVLVYVNRLDRIEKEPKSLILKLLLFGALSTIPAALMEMVGETVLSGVLEESLPYNVLLYFVVVGGSEEFCKRFFLKKYTWNHPAFDFLFDAIVYSVAVSLGFAILENVKYVLYTGITTALLRAVTAVPAHAIFGIFMGYYYGMAKFMQVRGNFSGYRKNMASSLLVPVLLHGLYDFLAVGGFEAAGMLFLALVIGLDFLALSRLRRSSRTDRRIHSDLYLD